MAYIPSDPYTSVVLDLSHVPNKLKLVEIGTLIYLKTHQLGCIQLLVDPHAHWD